MDKAATARRPAAVFQLLRINQPQHLTDLWLGPTAQAKQAAAYSSNPGTIAAHSIACGLFPGGRERSHHAAPFLISQG